MKEKPDKKKNNRTEVASKHTIIWGIGVDNFCQKSHIFHTETW